MLIINICPLALLFRQSVTKSVSNRIFPQSQCSTMPGSSWSCWRCSRWSGRRSPQTDPGRTEWPDWICLLIDFPSRRSFSAWLPAFRSGNQTLPGQRETTLTTSLRVISHLDQSSPLSFSKSTITELWVVQNIRYNCRSSKHYNFIREEEGGLSVCWWYIYVRNQLTLIRLCTHYSTTLTTSACCRLQYHQLSVTSPKVHW